MIYDIEKKKEFDSAMESNKGEKRKRKRKKKRKKNGSTFFSLVLPFPWLCFQFEQIGEEHLC